MESPASVDYYSCRESPDDNGASSCSSCFSSNQDIGPIDLGKTLDAEDFNELIHDVAEYTEDELEFLQNIKLSSKRLLTSRNTIDIEFDPLFENYESDLSASEKNLNEGISTVVHDDCQQTSVMEEVLIETDTFNTQLEKNVNENSVKEFTVHFPGTLSLTTNKTIDVSQLFRTCDEPKLYTETEFLAALKKQELSLHAVSLKNQQNSELNMLKALTESKHEIKSLTKLCYGFREVVQISSDLLAHLHDKNKRLSEELSELKLQKMIIVKDNELCAAKLKDFYANEMILKERIGDLEDLSLQQQQLIQKLKSQSFSDHSSDKNEKRTIIKSLTALTNHLINRESQLSLLETSLAGEKVKTNRLCEIVDELLIKVKNS